MRTMDRKKSNRHRIGEEINWILGLIIIIWIVFIADIFLPLEHLGLIPRDFGGLVGIVGMHFLHGSWYHLLSNTVPLLVLLVLLAGSKANSVSIVFVICLVGGIVLWFIGRSSLHIGASLLVFGLASFLVAAGFIEKRPIPLIISGIVMLIYGTSILRGILPFTPGVSWEGHISGLIGGAIAALTLIPKTNNSRYS